MLVIFFIGFIIRYLINKYLGINAFLDYTCIISIVYYLNLNGTVVYINNCDLSINTFKFIINWDNITYSNICNCIKCIIDGFINSNDRNKITMDWEGFSSLIT